MASKKKKSIAKKKTASPKKKVAAKPARAKTTKKTSTRARPASPKKKPLAKTLKDPTLGTLARDADLGCYTGSTKIGSHKVTFRIMETEDRALASLLPRARKVASGLAGYDVAAKKHAAKKLLKLKNGTWLDEEEEPVTATAFESRMQLESVSIGKGELVFFFRDGDLFWGHAILVELDAKDRPLSAEIAG